MRTMLFLLMCVVLAFGQQNAQQVNSHKPNGSEKAKPEQAVAPQGKSNQVDCEKKTPENFNKPEHIYKVEIISPSWATWLPIGISVLSVVFVWYQVKAIQISERAWMIGSPEFNNFTQKPATPQFVFYPVSCKNVGRTPTRILEAGVSLKWANSIKNFPKKPVYEADEIVKPKTIIVPQDSFALSAKLLPMSPDEFDLMMNQSLILYGHGFVKYVDAFGKKRETRFCHYYRVAGSNPAGIEGFTTCVEAPDGYNEAK